jgi:hypothetical protein
VHRLGPMDARYLQRLCPGSWLERAPLSPQPNSNNLPLQAASL